MKNKIFDRLIAGSICAAMALAAAPAVSAADTADDEDIVYFSDFEDQDVSAWDKRGDTDTTVLSASTDNAVSGSYSLCAGERSKSWNGPAFRIDDKVDPGTVLLISGQVMGQYYTEATLSLQYTDESGNQHYENLQKVNGSGWQSIEDVKVSYAEGQSEVFVYFEGGSNNLYVDDFMVKKAPVYHPEDIAGLKDVYRPYFKLGTAVTTKELAPASTKELILKHFNSITAGNELKPDAILDEKACLALAEEGDDTNPQVNLASARSILNFARDNGLSVRGHVLIWHQQTPTWFFKENYDASGEWVSKEKMLTRMENYIKNVFAAVEEEYPDVDFYAWDVVNECILDDGNARQPGSQEEGSAKSPWVQIFGDNSFIKPAFEFAKKYAPEGCKLYYNDFNEYMPQKYPAIVSLVEEINSDGHYIDGIGMQSHLGKDIFPAANVYEKALKAFVDTGLDIQVTELDHMISSPDNFEEQAQYYSDIMDILVKYSDSISAVVFWGTTDDQSWRAEQYPLLFNEDYTAKPAYYAIVDGLDVIPEPTTTTAATTAETTAATTTTASSDTAANYGDANEDSKINMADAVAVLQNLANGTKYPLTPQGEINADCDGDTGITGNDAITILRVESGEISQDTLPLAK
ncbi:MAG: endo-1,4-beta-xylanase [Ruminococcus sp.]|nr:endo-1,4-beta-xylanase [Ruminococcus sp.]